ECVCWLPTVFACLSDPVERIVRSLPIKVVEHARLHRDGLLVSDRKAMFHSQLRRPSPKISGERKRRDGERCKRTRGEWRNEQLVLARYYRRVGPIQAHARGLQSHNAEVDTIARPGK